MRESNFGIIQSPLQADLDRIAADVVDNLAADLVLLSVTNKSALVSLGISDSVRQVADSRWHVPEDMVCLHVAETDMPLVLRDACQHPEAAETRYVQEGLVVGYMGVPIRNAELGAIGAICCVTQAPRDWTDGDVRYLKAVAESIENLILREMYRLESMDASSLASEYDQIIAAFALVRAEPTSIHDENGRLVFANRALTDVVEEADLEGARIRAVLKADAKAPQLEFRTAEGETFTLSRLTTSSGYFVCQWKPSAQRLN